MSLIEAVILGIIEGITEFLPISSTGHLILVSEWLGLTGGAVKTFEIVIQAGGVSAVLGLYWARMRSMGRALRGQDEVGRRLVVNLGVSFVPAAAVGLLLREQIKSRLFGTGPVIAALALGGLLMIGLDAWLRGSRRGTQPMESMTTRQALLIGLAQCLALWPGTSRAMVTMVAGMLVGLPAAAAAEYSFLLALPTLGAAALLDAASDGGALVGQIGWPVLATGFIVAAGVAALAMKGLVHYLTRHGLSAFGWYRLGLAALVWLSAR